MSKMERKVYPLPDHPHRGKQHIVIERPDPTSVWYLVLEDTKMKPLVGLDRRPPTSPKDILEEFAKEYGEENVMQFVMQGYSLVNPVSRL